MLIIGDSISIGYTEPGREMLSEVAVVTHNPGNAADARKGLKELDAWIGVGEVGCDPLQLGASRSQTRQGRQVRPDRAKRVSTLEQYRDNLDQLVGRLKATGAKLIWASTTPIPDGAAGRIKGQEIEFNAAAREIMDKHGVAVNDLHTYVWPYLDKYQ